MDKAQALYPAGQTPFSPVFTIPNGTTDLSFYIEALNAIEHWCLRNDDGSVHVAEFFIDEAMFHVHEKTQWSKTVTPDEGSAGTMKIGLMVTDVHERMERALSAGGKLVSPTQDHEYGYRQGEFADPFGHHWILQCRIPTAADWPSQ